jgi:hypothetical protein
MPLLKLSHGGYFAQLNRLFGRYICFIQPNSKTLILVKCFAVSGLTNLRVLMPITQYTVFLCPANRSRHYHPQSGRFTLVRQCTGFVDQHVRGQTERIELAGKIDLIIGLNTATGIG